MPRAKCGVKQNRVLSAFVPDEPTHPEPAPVILDYRGPVKMAASAEPPFENPAARAAGGLAIASIAIFALMYFVAYLNGWSPIGGLGSEFVVGFFMLAVPIFVMAGIAAFVCGVLGLSRLRRTNKRGLVPSIMGIVAGVFVAAVFVLLGFLASRC